MKYYQLLALVCEDLPTTCIDGLMRAGHAATSDQMRAVRHGRRVDLPLLLDLVREGLPDFDVPEQLLPATPADTPVMLGL